MTRLVDRDAFAPDCPIRNIISRFGDKWSILTLLTLNSSGTLRFRELRRSLPDISQKMLTVTLRTLEEDGLVHRHIYPQIPPRVEYSLTTRAETLLPHIHALVDWAQENMPAIIRDRENTAAHFRGRTE